MFVGHTAVALLAKRRNASISLGAFLVATFALDLVWPVCLLLGIDQVRGAAPPSVTALAWFATANWLLIAWGAWGSRHRVARA